MGNNRASRLASRSTWLHLLALGFNGSLECSVGPGEHLTGEAVVCFHGCDRESG